jgi:hypothetical protein
VLPDGLHERVRQRTTRSPEPSRAGALPSNDTSQRVASAASPPSAPCIHAPRSLSDLDLAYLARHASRSANHLLPSPMK